MMVCQRHWRSFLCVVIFIFSATSLAGQKITESDILFLNSIRGDSLINDSILMERVKTLFFGDDSALRTVVYSLDDTNYFTSLRWKAMMMQNQENMEICLHDLSKKDSLYYLKCAFIYSQPKWGITDFMGFVSLPFCFVNGEIKFRNFFYEQGEKQFVKGNIPYLYTTAANVKNLDAIDRFIRRVMQKYGIKPDPTRKLYYAYDPENPCTVIGIDDYILSMQGTGYHVGNNFILFDKLGKGFYKHELAHYITYNTGINNFFSEGFASYVGGSSWKCDNRCDYESLLQFLEQHNSDSIIDNIIIMKTGFMAFYFKQYYPLGSITVHLLTKQYGNKLFENETMMKLMTGKSPENIYKFLLQHLNTSGQPLCQYYINELKKYLAEAGKNN